MYCVLENEKNHRLFGLIPAALQLDTGIYLIWLIQPNRVVIGTMAEKIFIVLVHCSFRNERFIIRGLRLIHCNMFVRGRM